MGVCPPPTPPNQHTFVFRHALAHLACRPDRVPKPDPNISKLEDKLVSDSKPRGSSASDLAEQTAKLSVGGDDGGPPIQFPWRPAYGSKGVATNVRANSFVLKVKEQDLYKYSITVTRKPAEGTPDDDQEVGRRDLRKVIELLLQHVKLLPAATEFKSHLITAQPFDNSGTIPIAYTKPGHRSPKQFNVSLDGPNRISVASLMQWLKDMCDPNDPTDQVFPKFPDAMDALGAIVSYTARSRNPEAQVAVVGQRILPLDLPSEMRNLDSAGMKTQSMYNALRGYFQSVRPATGRFLLNVNVAHGVVRKTGKISGLLEHCGLDVMDLKSWSVEDTKQYAKRLRDLSRELSRTRIRTEMHDDKDQPIMVERTIYSLATKGEGLETTRFTAGFPFAGPRQCHILVRLSTRDAAEDTGLAADTWETVEEYHRRRYGRILNPRFPLVNTGTRQRPCYIAAERCEIVQGQHLSGKLPGPDNKEMLSFACRSPAENQTSISTMGRQVLGLDDNPVLRAFGLSVDQELVTVQSRILSCPMVMYKNMNNPKQNTTVLAYEGGWNMKGVRVFKPGRPVKSWLWVQCSRRTARAAASAEMSDRP